VEDQADELLELEPGAVETLIIDPRWPYQRVLISRRAFLALVCAQAQLGPEIELVITRALEARTMFLPTLHSFGRLVGGLLFVLMYPRRAHERGEIFSPNGHDKDARQVDVALRVHQERKTLLPYGVFSTKRHINKIRVSEQLLLERVYRVLEDVGFRIHSNPTEALQTHCSFYGG